MQVEIIGGCVFVTRGPSQIVGHAVVFLPFLLNVRTGAEKGWYENSPDHDQDYDNLPSRHPTTGSGWFAVAGLRWIEPR